MNKKNNHLHVIDLSSREPSEKPSGVSAAGSGKPPDGGHPNPSMSRPAVPVSESVQPPSSSQLETFYAGCSEEERQFLLKTSILTRLSPPLCNAVTQRTDSRRILRELSKKTSLLIPQDSHGVYYQCNPSLSFFLRHRLFRTNRALVPTLFQAASAHCQEAGHVTEAIHYSIRGKDHATSIRLLESYAAGLSGNRKQMQLFRRCCARIPDSVRNASPLLLLALGWIALLEKDSLLLEKNLQHTKTWIRTHPEVPENQDQHPLIRQEYLALRLHQHLSSGANGKALFILHQMNFSSGAPSLFPELIAACWQRETAPSLLWSPWGWNGNVRLYQEHQPMFTQFWGRYAPPHQGISALLEAECLYEANELERAMPLLMKGLKESRESGAWGIFVPAVFLLSKILRTQGNESEARACLDEAVQQLDAVGETSRYNRGLAMKAHLEAVTGNLPPAIEWMNHAELTLSQCLTGQNQFEKLVKARIDLYNRNYDQSCMELLQLEAYATEKRNWRLLTEILSLLAVCLDQRNEKTSAIHAMKRSMQIGVRTGCRRVFLDEGAPLLPPLRDTHTELKKMQGKEILLPELSRFLLHEIRRGAQHQRICHATQLSSCDNGLIEALTAKELQVLRCLAEGRSNQEIADLLHIKVSTVKTHTRNIYGKLCVSNRTQAVSTARTHQLL